VILSANPDATVLEVAAVSRVSCPLIAVLDPLTGLLGRDDGWLVEANVHVVGMTAWGGGGAVCAVAEPSTSRPRGGGP
jgi:hypothetical protein